MIVEKVRDLALKYYDNLLKEKNPTRLAQAIKGIVQLESDLANATNLEALRTIESNLNQYFNNIVLMTASEIPLIPLNGIITKHIEHFFVKDDIANTNKIVSLEKNEKFNLTTTNLKIDNVTIIALRGLDGTVLTASSIKDEILITKPYSGYSNYAHSLFIIEGYAMKTSSYNGRFYLRTYNTSTNSFTMLYDTGYRITGGTYAPVRFDNINAYSESGYIHMYMYRISGLVLRAALLDPVRDNSDIDPTAT